MYVFLTLTFLHTRSYIGVVGGAAAVASDIAKVAQERKADQVVMGTRGWSSALGLGVSLGSVSTAVLQRVNCPVTLVKDFEEGKDTSSPGEVSTTPPLATP